MDIEKDDAMKPHVFGKESHKVFILIYLARFFYCDNFIWKNQNKLNNKKYLAI